MNIEHVHDKIRYTLTNDALKEGDEVFPIGCGRCLDDGGWILHKLDYREVMSGFPNTPHIIMDLNHANGKQSKAYEIRTDMGYGPKESYFKIIKKEEKRKIKDTFFGGTYEWFEIK
jgi:hypothetical protein